MMARFGGEKRRHTVRELLRWHYAFLRGGTRTFGKFWGTAIYGQCDPAIAPQAFATPYDMGASYSWFWTSNQGLPASGEAKREGVARMSGSQAGCL